MSWTVEDILKVFEESDSDETEPCNFTYYEEITTNQKNKIVDTNLNTLESLNYIDFDNENFPESNEQKQNSSNKKDSTLAKHKEYMKEDSESGGKGEKQKTEKPPFSYGFIIMMALQQSPEKMLTRNGIYEFFVKNYPYYSNIKSCKACINYNLRRNKCFIQDTRHDNYWMIDPTHNDFFMDGSTGELRLMSTRSQRSMSQINKTRFSDYQVNLLQEFFEKNVYPSADDFRSLSTLLGLTPKVIGNWFKNARQRASAQGSTLTRSQEAEKS